MNIKCARVTVRDESVSSLTRFRLDINQSRRQNPVSNASTLSYPIEQYITFFLLINVFQKKFYLIRKVIIFPDQSQFLYLLCFQHGMTVTSTYPPLAFRTFRNFMILSLSFKYSVFFISIASRRFSYSSISSQSKQTVFYLSPVIISHRQRTQ